MKSEFFPTSNWSWLWLNSAEKWYIEQILGNLKNFGKDKEAPGEWASLKGNCTTKNRKAKQINKISSEKQSSEMTSNATTRQECCSLHPHYHGLCLSPWQHCQSCLWTLDVAAAAFATENSLESLLFYIISFRLQIHGRCIWLTEPRSTSDNLHSSCLRGLENNELAFVGFFSERCALIPTKTQVQKISQT